MCYIWFEVVDMKHYVLMQIELIQSPLPLLQWYPDLNVISKISWSSLRLNGFQGCTLYFTYKRPAEFFSFFFAQPTSHERLTSNCLGSLLELISFLVITLNSCVK